MSPRLVVRPRSVGAMRRQAAGGLTLDVAEVARFVAERDEDASRERWLVIGQGLALMAVLALVALMVAFQRG